MSFSSSLLDRVFAAQTSNSSLRGPELRDAGGAIASLAVRAGYALMAADDAGERLVGAALCADDQVACVDSSQRLDDLSVLLVAGHVAGMTGIAFKASLVRSLGARRVQAVLLGEEHTSVVGCERVTNLTLHQYLVAL